MPASASARSWRRRVLIGYLILVAASQGLALRPVPDPAPVPEPFQAIEVPAYRDDERLASAVTVAVADRGDTGRPLLLLHGSPGSSDAFGTLLQKLPPDRRVIRIDLPGFGRSQLRVPNYSIRTHAHQVLAVLDQLEVGEVDVLAFSMGGGVVLNMIDVAPTRVRSMTLLGAIGVQEMELLGNYELNHLVHGTQLWALRLLRVLVPHLGAWRYGGLDETYARNFFDTDQRPLREILGRVTIPTLILHGETDPLVPVGAAREHHRLVPHSQLAIHPEGHFLPWQQPGWILDHLLPFLDEVEAGTAATQVDATEARIAAAQSGPPRGEAARTRGLGLILLGTLIVLGTFLTEDLTCVSTGLMISLGRLDWWTGVGLCFAGIFLGDLLLYAVGRALGPRVTKRAPLKWVLSEDKLQDAADWFDRRGMAVIFLTRFIPGLRLPTYVAAGVIRARFVSFAAYFFIAVLVWTPAIIGLSVLAGASALDTVERYRHLSVWILLGLALAMLIALRIVPQLCRWSGRRRLLGAWRRLTRWEYWPSWLIYPPVAMHILGLGLKYRSLTLFTAVNPGIDSGGFVGESKSDILRLFGGDPRVAPWILVDGTDDLADVDVFVARHGLPVVLKPDVGERGRGVQILRSPEAVGAALESIEEPHLLQAYVDGVEVGIFYERHPQAERGEIVSVARKVLPELVGDGVSTLERLILADERAVCMADHYLRRHPDARERIPAEGETVRLVELGTHSRGAIFLDGQDLLTDALAREVDELSRRATGFYFGRYDLRAPDEASLREGRDLRVLELNGVTSEPAHVYDPAWSLWRAQRALQRQWSRAFEIAAVNREAGVAPTGVAGLLERLRTR